MKINTLNIKITINPINGCNVGCSYCNCPRKLMRVVDPKDSLFIADLFLFLKTFFKQFNELHNKDNIKLLFDINGGEPCILEKEQILKYINLISKHTHDNNLGKPIITILSNCHRGVEYYQYIIDNANATVCYTFTYHAEYFEFNQIKQKVTELLNANPDAAIKLKINNIYVDLFEQLDNDPFQKHITMYKVNEDPMTPAVEHVENLLQEYELFSNGNIQDKDLNNFTRPGDFQMIIQ